ncbi:unnamed protein product [Arabis nemorensis]|uniref:Uncharacterized protein n=1 Tax=Arabis nemorensis TaxID=586526 RepID=A0A565AZJ1_9BRAS|nr:unnamed protein product [Arabis nemorensis]VVB01734.1 unnamed protein product [Arabis nemorensis]
MNKSPGKVAEDPSPAKSKRVVASNKAGGSKSKKQKCTVIVEVELKVDDSSSLNRRSYSSLKNNNKLNTSGC